MSQQLSEPTKAELQLAELVGKISLKQTVYCYINPFGFITKNYSYCALGGIAKNLGLPNTHILFYPERVKKIIQEKLQMSEKEQKQFYKCSKCNEKRKLLNMIPHLNDKHKMNWKEIASEIKSIHKNRLDPNKNYNTVREFVRSWIDRAFGN